MNKRIVRIIIFALLAICIGGGGFLLGKTLYQKPNLEVRIGHPDTNYGNVLLTDKVFTDIGHSNITNNILMIFLYRTPIENSNVDVNKPDKSITINSLKENTGLIEAKIWFLSDKAIIGMRVGESWDKIEFSEIDQNSAQYIKSLEGN